MEYALVHRPSSFTSIFILQENIHTQRAWWHFPQAGMTKRLQGLSPNVRIPSDPLSCMDSVSCWFSNLLRGFSTGFFSQFSSLHKKTTTQNSNPILRHEHITAILWKLFRVSRVNEKVHLLFGNCNLATENSVHYILLTLYLARESFHSFPIQIIDDNLEHEGARLINN